MRKLDYSGNLSSPYDSTDPTRDCKIWMSDKFTIFPPLVCEVCIHEVLEYLDQP